MSEENKAIARRAIEELFNQGNLDVADELIAPNYVNHDPVSPEEARGPEGFKQLVCGFRSAFPDLHFRIEDQIAEGDTAMTRWSALGTHQGELMGIAPTGNQVSVTGVGIDRIAGGKIEETWVYYDALGMLRQLGVVPAPEQA